ncbi:MAG TPA: nickel pincer cofactor biosynthesis protein LarC [Longimicrobiales bacterium]
MRALIFDPFAGVSGDMILGALVDVGLPAAWLEGFVASLGLGEVRVVVERANRRGISCGRVHFELPPQHSHRHLAHVLEMVEGCSAAAPVKARAGDTFRRLAQAEAEVHGTTIERVHFHEVGALDAILDVLCAVAGLAELGVEGCYTRPVQLGRGWVTMAHGRFPVPAPATLELLSGLPVRDDGLEGECTTPTGAALLATLTEGRSAPADYTPLRSGFGAGGRDDPDRPNCLRVILAEVAGAAGAEEGGTRLLLVQSDVDDMPPEYLPGAQQALLEAGALDAVLLPLTMKKGRAGARLEALVPEPALERTLAALFRETSSIGARYWPVTRPALARTEETVEWRGQSVRRKRVRLPDGSERAKPEHDDVVRAARAVGLSPYQARLELEGEE